MTSRSTGPWLIFLAAMLWATDGPFRTALLSHLPASTIVLAEHGINVLLLLPILLPRLSRLRALSAKEWAALIGIAVGGSAIATYAFTLSFAYVNPSVAILLQKLQPLIAITLAWSLLGERMKTKFWVWAILAIAGAYVISFPDLVPRVYEGEQWNPNAIGVGLALLAAVLWGGSTVLGKYALRRVDFPLVTSLRFVVAFLFLLLWQGCTGELAGVANVSARDWSFLCIIAFVSGSISLWIYYKGLTVTKASIATIAEIGFAPAAVIVNAFFIANTSLAPVQIAGMAMLLVAVLLLQRE